MTQKLLTVKNIQYSSTHTGADTGFQERGQSTIRARSARANFLDTPTK